jgi:hypothetical protein
MVSADFFLAADDFGGRMNTTSVDSRLCCDSYRRERRGDPTQELLLDALTASCELYSFVLSLGCFSAISV